MENILYIDESGINSTEKSLYGWSVKGTRCKDLKDGGHGKRFGLISAVRANAAYQFIAPVVFNGTCDRQFFTEWLEYLLKELGEKKHVLILDNASIHKGGEIEYIANKYDARIVYLPAYSPDLNPIERAWSVLKSKIKHIVSQQDLGVEKAIEIAFSKM